MIDKSRKELTQAILLEINNIAVDKGDYEDIHLLCIMLNLINTWKTEIVMMKNLEKLCDNEKMVKAFRKLKQIV
ncbi:MAG: hypothetical protein ACRC0G_03450 [Fusobacteriaceae bacterium]